MVSWGPGAACYWLEIPSAFVGSPGDAPNIDLLSADGDIGVLWVAIHVAIGANS